MPAPFRPRYASARQAVLGMVMRAVDDDREITMIRRERGCSEECSWDGFMPSAELCGAQMSYAFSILEAEFEAAKAAPLYSTIGCQTGRSEAESQDPTPRLGDADEYVLDSASRFRGDRLWAPHWNPALAGMSGDGVDEYE